MDSDLDPARGLAIEFSCGEASRPVAAEVTRLEEQSRRASETITLGPKAHPKGGLEPQTIAERVFVDCATRKGLDDGARRARRSLAVSYVSARVALVKRRLVITAKKSDSLRCRQRRDSCSRPRGRRRARHTSARATRDGPSDESEGDGEGPPSPGRHDLTAGLGLCIIRSAGLELPFPVAASLALLEQEAAR